MNQRSILEWALFGIESKLDNFLRNEQRYILLEQKAEIKKLITIEKRNGGIVK